MSSTHLRLDFLLFSRVFFAGRHSLVDSVGSQNRRDRIGGGERTNARGLQHSGKTEHRSRASLRISRSPVIIRQNLLMRLRSICTPWCYRVRARIELSCSWSMRAYATCERSATKSVMCTGTEPTGTRQSNYAYTILSRSP